MEDKDLTTKDARQNQKHFINVKLAIVSFSRITGSKPHI